MNTEITNAVNAAGDKAQYDARVKRILATLIAQGISAVFSLVIFFCRIVSKEGHAFKNGLQLK